MTLFPRKWQLKTETQGYLNQLASGFYVKTTLVPQQGLSTFDVRTSLQLARSLVWICKERTICQPS